MTPCFSYYNSSNLRLRGHLPRSCHGSQTIRVRCFCSCCSPNLRVSLDFDSLCSEYHSERNGRSSGDIESLNDINTLVASPVYQRVLTTHARGSLRPGNSHRIFVDEQRLGNRRPIIPEIYYFNLCGTCLCSCGLLPIASVG